MNGSIGQRSPGTWELTVDVGRDLSGKRRREYTTVRGTKRDGLGEVMGQGERRHGRAVKGAAGRDVRSTG